MWAICQSRRPPKINKYAVLGLKFLGSADLLGTESGSEKSLFLEEPSTGTRLLAGLPGVLPSDTIGLLEAMLPRENDQKH